jgi:hypothetical protein
MKKKIIVSLSLLLLVFLPFILGMGSIGGSTSPDKIPEPNKKFSAMFIDQYDLVMECWDISIQGSTFIEGKRGAGTIAIDFDKISYVLFQQSGGVLKGIIKMRDDNAIELTLKKQLLAYGRTPYGTYQIQLGDLKMIKNIHPR